MPSSASLWAAGSAPLLEAMKKAATLLRQAGVPFALAGGGAAYARGAAPPAHDVDFVIVEADAAAAARALAAGGLTIERPPEGWLIKAFDGDQMIDLIHCLGGVPVTRELLERAEELDVAALRLPVLDATDLVLSWLRSFTEHYADFAGTLTCVRPLREQVDWNLVRRETGQSAFARAFLVLLEGLGVIHVPPGPDNAPAQAAGRIERALATDPRTHELGVRVEMDEGVVYLRGEVAADARRQLIAEVAREAAPDLAVRSEVSVTEVRPPAEGTPILARPEAGA
ncbi:MAG: BON domain-containing protein [Actinobacteria bacterium]|nr:BON domain-containing protein [Actinomycetota bacterium]